MKNILGLDFGDVIIDSTSIDKVKFQKSDKLLEKTFVPHALESIKQLIPKFDATYIVSRVDKGNERMVIEWLTDKDFFKLSGISKDDVYFVQTRGEKGDLCEKLGITHYIDDHLEVLAQLKTVKHKYLLKYNPKDDEDRDFKHAEGEVYIAHSWPEMLKVINL